MRVARASVLASVAALSIGAALAGAPKFSFKPDDPLIPLDRVIIMTTGEPESRPLLVIDLTTGVALKQCPAGLWSGKAVFVGGVGGDVEFEGQFWRCFPFGEGTARYPNDTSYVGTVNTYVDETVRNALISNDFEARVIDAGSVHVAVREGRGTVYRADGKAAPGVFRRGEAFKDNPKLPDQRLVNYDAALAALVEAGRKAVEDAARRREEARLAEEARKAEEARRAEEARLAEEARRAEDARLAEEARRQQLAAIALDAAQLRAMLDGSQPGAPLAKSGVASCVNALAAQRKFFAAVNQRRPADTALLADLQTTLYQLAQRIGLLERACAGQPEYAEYALDVLARQRLESACLAQTGDAAQCAADIAW